MRIVTCAFLFRENKIVLGLKKRGFGVGKWNGYGGKLMTGETAEDAVIREIEEESGIKVLKENLNHLGTIDFHFLDNPDWDQQAYIYRIDSWEGEPVETEEMNPKWYSVDALPYESMWIDDPYWLPYLLSGEHFTAEFHFDAEGKKIKKQVVKIDD